MRRKGTAAAAVGALVLLLAATGCGGEERPAAPTESVEAAIFSGGIQQNVRCEPAGEREVRGESRAIFRCSFEEEQNISGAMRAMGGCYVLEDGELIDVTRDLPVGTACSVTGS